MNNIISIISFLLVSIIGFGCNDNRTIQLYLAPDGDDTNAGTFDYPLQSLDAVMYKISILRENTKLKNFEIFLRGGIYELDNTFILDGNGNYNGSVKITFESYENENVTLSGGKRIDNWEDSGNGFWQAALDEEIYFEQLFINGRFSIRARTPNKSSDNSQWFLRKAEFDQDDSGTITRLDIYLKDAEMENLGQVNYGEIVVLKDWATFRKQIERVDPEESFVRVKLPVTGPTKPQGSHNSLYSHERQPGYSAYLEGHPVMVDEAGEWALDTINHKVIYNPLPDESIRDLNAYYPVLSKLVLFEGSKESPVCDIHFHNIRFSHCGYWLPESGHDGSQATMFYTGNPRDIINEELVITEAVRLEYANNCSFENCRFSMLGSSGLRLARGCKDILINNCIFNEIGGNCLMSGMKNDSQPDSLDMVADITISGNIIHHGGKLYPSGVGIWLGFCHSHVVTGNTVSELPYTGISVGWQWNPLPSSASHNRIVNNHIHHVMKTLGDGGGIYTLGKQPGSILKGNLIHDIERSRFNNASPNNGMFIDEGSKDYLVEGNLIYQVAGSPIRGHRSAGVFIKNNVFISLPGEPGIMHSPPYSNLIVVFENQQVSWIRPPSISADHYPDTVAAMFLEGNKFMQENMGIDIDFLTDSLDLQTYRSDH